MAELEDNILPGEAERRYDEYKTEFIRTQNRSFFEQHKDDDWLQEKCDPAWLEAVLVRRNENAKILAKELLAELQGSSLDVGQVLLDLQKKSQRMMEMWQPKGEGKADQPKSPRRSMQLQKHQQGVLIQREW
jgi:hypothetical protein